MNELEAQTPDYTCECPLDEPEARSRYRVTGHDGTVAICDYCPCCADLATVDWNGETAAIEPLL